MFGNLFSGSNGNSSNDLKNKENNNFINNKSTFDKRVGDKYVNYIITQSESDKTVISNQKNKSSDKVIKIVNGIEQISSSECNSDETVILKKSFGSSINIIKESNEEDGETKDGKNIKNTTLSVEKSNPNIDKVIDKIMNDKNEYNE